MENNNDARSSKKPVTEPALLPRQVLAAAMISDRAIQMLRRVETYYLEKFASGKCDDGKTLDLHDHKDFDEACANVVYLVARSLAEDALLDKRRRGIKRLQLLSHIMTDDTLLEHLFLEFKKNGKTRGGLHKHEKN